MCASYGHFILSCSPPAPYIYSEYCVPNYTPPTLRRPAMADAILHRFLALLLVFLISNRLTVIAIPLLSQGRETVRAPPPNNYNDLYLWPKPPSQLIL